MTYVLGIEEIRLEDRPAVGGKAFNLARLRENGFAVPQTVCVTARAYDLFVDRSGIRERIQMELNRKPFAEMRWEEVWDAALRIRHLFSAHSLPARLDAEIAGVCEARFGDRPVVVRSSAPEEDDARASFAGLHESYLNLRGREKISKHLRLVWASLWSDAALLYRQELGLTVESSAMAVVIQEIVTGRCSGVAFSKSPDNPAQGVVEAVFGLNAGLVDGVVAPDRWHLDRTSRHVLTHSRAERETHMAASDSGVRIAPLPEYLKTAPMLSEHDVVSLFGQVMRAEGCFGSPQDMEWTHTDRGFVFLQSRPITTGSGRDADDKRGWYLSLHRSFENLVALRRRIEGELIPAMIREAGHLAQIDPGLLSDDALEEEAERRRKINDHWVRVYWDDFIPYAHGVRLFGQFYNDAMTPEDPYEFLDLLAPDSLESLARNGMLEQMAALLRDRPAARLQLEKMDLKRLDKDLAELLGRFRKRFGDLACTLTDAPGCRQENEALIRIVLEMAAHPPTRPRERRQDAASLETRFLNRFAGEERDRAAAMLSLARSSYRLRDDDNIHLGRIEAQLFAALNEQARRREDSPAPVAAARSPAAASPPDGGSRPRFNAKPRQLVGQPAGPGMARAPARVVRRSEDLLAFKAGEALVCDAVDPNMTFVVPLAAGIVERRGGMLIHGAIIAREYGIPCVTGVPGATDLIATGDLLNVDGYLGIVTVG